MKRITYLLALSLLAQCQDQSQSREELSKFSNDIGQAIPIVVAERWAGRYQSTISREQNRYSISRESLTALTNAITDYDGIVFQHGWEDDRHHIFVIPYKMSLPLWSAAIVFDANLDQAIEVSRAQTLSANYRNENPSGPWSHFFGSHVFQEILLSDDFNRFDIVLATDDKGVSQLLLYVWHSDNSSTGRSQSELVQVYDVSSPCPPSCPQ